MMYSALQVMAFLLPPCSAAIRNSVMQCSVANKAVTKLTIITLPAKDNAVGLLLLQVNSVKRRPVPISVSIAIAMRWRADCNLPSMINGIWELEHQQAVNAFRLIE